MFTNPIRHTRISSMKELMKFSYRTDMRSEHKLVVTQNNGQIAFSDEYGRIYVTPYRSEIHGILAEAGYIEKYVLSVPFSNREERPDAYKWLAKIADEENWAETYEEAYKISQEKGIEPVSLSSRQYHIKEIRYYVDPETNIAYSAMTMMFLHNDSRDNIGTYIIVDEKTLLICDEFGRTFLLKAKTVVNEIVNKLIEAGYTRCAYPYRYIMFIPKQDEVAE